METLRSLRWLAGILKDLGGGVQAAFVTDVEANVAAEEEVGP